METAKGIGLMIIVAIISQAITDSLTGNVQPGSALATVIPWVLRLLVTGTVATVPAAMAFILLRRDMASARATEAESTKKVNEALVGLEVRIDAGIKRLDERIGGIVSQMQGMKVDIAELKDRGR